MKKAISLIAISILTASLLFGCKAKTVDNQNNGANQNSTAQNGQNQGNSNGRGQFQRADLSGQVVSIKGNAVTIKVIKQPQFTQQNGNNNNGSSNGNGNNSSNNNSNNNNNNNTGNNNNPNSNNGNGNNQGQRPRRQLEFTGETKTITIPDGTSITTMVRGNQGRQTEQLKVSDLKANDILQIWYADKNKGTFSKITVQEYGVNGNGGNGNNSNSNSNNNSNSSNQSSSST
ncbi:hypothetical protein [Candidatus Clostridium radicumherbarum]|uniref:DUF5666 domain-containing protein n=1 Tax=Candidatus Clostridium radicumherbarum TaxID=3381662 RepID=A0ABW8TNG3_9CLOT